MSIFCLRRAAGAAGSVVAAAAIAVGLGAAPAGASTFFNSSLSIVELANNDFRITVTGHVEMSAADATTACGHPGDPVQVELYGQDQGFTGADDLLVTKTEFDAMTMTCTAVSTGLNFSVALIRDGDILNEDAGEDEVYAYVTFLDIRTGQTHVDASNVIIDRF